VARLLLDAGADPVGRSGGQRGRGGWTPLRCAVAGATNPQVVALLLERGAEPDDHDLYLAGTAEMALAAPISQDDAEGARLLLEAGADPNHYADDDGAPASALYEAVRSGCSAELVELLLVHGALLDAGASTADVTLDPDDSTPPSPEVAALLRAVMG
jgi:ankyrin repeat protein